MRIARTWGILLLAGLFTAVAGRASADLIGQWTFNPDEELIDLMGNFPDLGLKGDAAIVETGELDVNGIGTTATGWAVTEGGDYDGPVITNKTMVSWITLQGLSDVAVAGSAITIDRLSGDQFDGIIFGERQTNRWMNGSSFFSRTSDFVPGFQEITTDAMIQMAVTYEHIGGQLQVTGYRNGEQIGQYLSNSPSSWNPGDAEVFFGLRHGSTVGGPGGLDALIDEARIYDEVLTQAQIQELVPVPLLKPQPTTFHITPHDVGLPDGVQVVGGTIRTNGEMGEGLSFSDLEPTFELELTNGDTTQILTELDATIAMSVDEPLFDVTEETITFLPDAGQFIRFNADEAPFSGFFWSGESPHDSGLLAVEVDGISEIATPPPAGIGNFAVRASGDANGDGIVDAADLAIVLANWSTGDTYATGDFNGDDAVDAADLSRLFGTPADPAIATATAQFAAVPEPSTWVLALVGLLGFLGRSRRRHQRIV
jgi:hypothetical protein